MPRFWRIIIKSLILEGKKESELLYSSQNAVLVKGRLKTIAKKSAEASINIVFKKKCLKSCE